MKKGGWEKPACEICKTKKYLEVFLDKVTTWEHKGHFRYVKCSNCGLVFQSPRPRFEEAIKYYPSHSYWGRDVKKFLKVGGWKKEREKGYSELYKEIFKRKKKGRILDIGSGIGIFLSKFKEKGWKVTGTDISKDVAEYAEKVFGVKTLIGDIVKMDLPKGHFDVISLNNVLEHIYTQRKTLLKINSLLKDDGLLLIVIPNVDGLGLSLFGKDWIQLQPARHLYLFSPTTIRVLLEETGFKVEKISHRNWEHNYYSIFQSFRYRFSPRFKKKPRGGLAEGRLKDLSKASEKSIIKEAGKIAGKVIAFIVTAVEHLINRSDIMVLYAKKRKKD